MGSSRLVLGVDVGTSSVRAGLFDLKGRMVGHAACPIEIARPAPDFAEQSSEDIWQAASRAVRESLAAAGAAPGEVQGLGFDATCSLVALDAAGRPVTVSPTGDDRWNVVMWMDHRAVAQAERINSIGHEVLRYVGGRLSPEMEPPKLLWIKESLPGSWQRAARFLDLADFLTYRSTGSDVRSTCTTVCKWTYLGHEGRWAPDFFQGIGLPDLLGSAAGEGGRAGEAVKPMGTPLGRGLTPIAARELGLEPGTAVGVGIIDAHAGALGVLGAEGARLAGEEAPRALERVLALVGGTSSCHLAVSREPRFINGIWGPYFSALVPGLWLTEGGQSATGSLIDHVLSDSAASARLKSEARERGQTVYQVLNGELERLEAAEGGPVHDGPVHDGAVHDGPVQGGELTADLHVLPYFHGNRSPRADASLRGVVSGLSLDDTLPGLARRYLAVLQAIAYGTRHIIEAMNSAGYQIDTIHACGGGTKNPFWLREHADATGCRLVLPREPEAVLLGSAILGAVAAGAEPSILAAMRSMGGSEKVISPDPRRRGFHQRKYTVFLKMYQHFLELRKIMARG